MWTRTILMGVVFVVLASDKTLACSPPAPSIDMEAVVITPEDKTPYFLKLVPPVRDKNFVIKKESYGIAYKVRKDGQFEQLWSMKGLYDSPEDRDYLLSGDGQYLVKINSAGSIADKNALIIYHQGKIFKQYAPVDFLTGKPKLDRDSCGHIHWLTYPDTAPFQEVSLRTGGYLHFKTVDGIEWTFNVREKPYKTLSNLPATISGPTQPANNAAW